MNHSNTILVVDDDSHSLRLLTDALTGGGYRVRPADSGELALASVGAIAPGLILLDIRMPGMDGFEVCRRLKARSRLARFRSSFSVPPGRSKIGCSG